MKNVKCVLRTDYKRKDNLHIIYLRYSYNRKFVLFNTKVEASLLNWNKRLGRLRKSLHYEKKNDFKTGNDKAGNLLAAERPNNWYCRNCKNKW